MDLQLAAMVLAALAPAGATAVAPCTTLVLAPAIALAAPAALDPTATAVDATPAAPAAAAPATHARVPDDDGDGNPDNLCRNGHFPSYGRFRIARVAPSGPAATLLHDEDDCPTSGDCARAALPRGAEVITARRYRDWTCVWRFPDDAEAPELVGWLATSDLRTLRPPAPATASWIGTWTAGEDEIHVARAGRDLRADGTAIWHGYGDNTHEGAFTATGAPIGSRLRLVESGSGCEVELDRVGRYLIAHDNRQCGGVNVAFDGVYRLRR